MQRITAPTGVGVWPHQPGLGVRLPRGGGQLGGLIFIDQLDRNAKTLLKGALTRLDVVSREEFDAQTAVLRRTRERLEQVERDLASLSQSLDSPDGPNGS